MAYSPSTQLKPVVIERFGGLDLRNDPEELGASSASDMLNVDLDRLGRLRTRDGYEVYNTSAVSSTGYEAGLFGSRLNGGELLATRNVTTSIYLDQLATDGTLTNIGNWSASTGAVVTATAHLGTPTASTVYLASAGISGAGFTLRKYNGTALSTGTGKPMFVATSPTSNRLVQGHYFAAADSPSGANGSPSTVFFSNQGAPDTYTATNFVPLRPGDGEGITGIVSFRDKIIVFKQTAMFVFYGENTDDEGLTEFAYREAPLPATITYAPVPSGLGVTAIPGRFVVAGDDAVYFSTRKGIFETDGTTIKSISDEIQPLFVPGDSDIPANVKMFVGISTVPPVLSWVRGSLIGSYVQSGSGDGRYLVWDPTSKAWRVWGTTQLATHFAEVPMESRQATNAAAFAPAVFFVFASDPLDNNIYRMARDVTTDDGVVIDWTYTSGYYDLGNPGQKRLRYTDVYGAGTVTARMLGLGGRPGAVADTGSALTLGTAPDIARARRASNLRARIYAHKLSGSGVARVNRLEHRFASGSRTT